MPVALGGGAPPGAPSGGSAGGIAGLIAALASSGALGAGGGGALSSGGLVPGGVPGGIFDPLNPGVLAARLPLFLSYVRGRSPAPPSYRERPTMVPSPEGPPGSGPGVPMTNMASFGDADLRARLLRSLRGVR